MTKKKTLKNVLATAAFAATMVAPGQGKAEEASAPDVDSATRDAIVQTIQFDRSNMSEWYTNSVIDAVSVYRQSFMRDDSTDAVEFRSDRLFSPGEMLTEVCNGSVRTEYKQDDGWTRVFVLDGAKKIELSKDEKGAVRWASVEDGNSGLALSFDERGMMLDMVDAHISGKEASSVLAAIAGPDRSVADFFKTKEFKEVTREIQRDLKEGGLVLGKEKLTGLGAQMLREAREATK